MKEPTKASFGFRKFTVPKFSYNKPDKSNIELDLFFDPKGKYNQNTGTYLLELNFQGADKEDKNIVVNVVSIAEFHFSEKIPVSEIPEFFYANAIAIMFPYVRSFVSTLTLQSNTGIIMLETLNLTSLKDVLKTNTKSTKES